MNRTGRANAEVPDWLVDPSRLLLAVWLLLVASVACAERPNVLLVVADDLGFADLGCYGGEIDTPNLDGLASDGVRFSQFRATPMCTTSRVALMAGTPLHRAGGLEYRNSAPLPAVVRRAGYQTLMVGKWHAGKPSPRSPELFDRSFGFLGGMTDCYAGSDDWFLGDQDYDAFTEGFDATTAFTDHAIEFMSEAIESDAPFFLYAAYNAPHHPCQARRETVEKYRQRYLAGYEAIAAKRRTRQAELGLLPPDLRRAPLGAEVRRWDELSVHRQRVEADRMAAYAAAVDELDQGIGRLLHFLDEAGVAGETLVVFLSDNGGDYNNGSLREDEDQKPWLPGHNPSSSNGWAAVKNTPFRYYKHTCHEGALATPLIVRWPGRLAATPGGIDPGACHITDLYPTILEAIGEPPAVKYAGHPVRASSGLSLVPRLSGRVAAPRGPVFEWFDHSHAWIDGDWKAVGLYDGPWQLFDLANDRGETTDLATEEPERLAKMVAAWEHAAKRDQVPSVPVLRTSPRGWGWHRLRMVTPGLRSIHPPNSQTIDSCRVRLSLEFDEPLDFRGTAGRTICLHEVGNEETPVWTADPDARHPAQGERQIEFTDLPRLKADTHYFMLWDKGWAKVGGRALRQLNDGAYWWRFRTAPASLASASEGVPQ